MPLRHCRQVQDLILREEDAPWRPRSRGAWEKWEQEGAEPVGGILTSIQGQVIIGVCQRRCCPEPSQCGVARRQGGGGMKHGQERKQSQQVTWQVLSELCNESRGMCDAFHHHHRRPPPAPFFFLSSQEAGSSLRVGQGSTKQLL